MLATIFGAEVRRVRTIVAVSLVLGLLASFAAGDEAELAASKVRAAEAKVAAKDYSAALKLYDEAFRIAPPDRAVLVDAAQCAFLAKAMERAAAWARTASEGASAEFLESEKGRLLRSLLVDLEKEARRARERFTWTLTEKAIKNLPLHMKGLDMSLLDPGRPEDPTPRYALKKEHRGADVHVTVYPHEEGDVKVVIGHHLETRELAEQRFEAISNLIRGQMSAWNAKYRGRPRKKLSEFRADVTSIEPVRGKTAQRRLLFCFDRTDGESAFLSSPALVDLWGPAEDSEPKEADKRPWEVTVLLHSLYFR